MDRTLPFIALLLLASCSSSPTPYEKMEMETTQVQGQKLKSTADSRDEQLNTLRSTVQEQDRTTSVSPDAVPPDSIGVELLWQVPNENVVAYHFYYGTKPSEPAQHIRVPVDRIERLAHPVYGNVFRYRLQGSFPESELFVSIRAENENGLSPESREIRIPVSHNVGVDSKGIEIRDEDPADSEDLKY